MLVMPTRAQRLVPRLVEYFQWWSTTRDIDGNGLITIIHGCCAVLLFIARHACSWESGLDASPAYDLAYFVDVPQVCGRG